jgi:Tfp pilus assembly protein PilF
LAVTDQLATAVPDDPAVRAMRAQALLGSDQPEEALAEARRAVELDDNNEYAQRLMGLTAWRQERLTLAQESLSRAVVLSRRRPEVLAEYAWFMANERGPRLAEKAAQEAIDADGTMSTAWAALGLAQHRLRRRNEAEVSLRRALELNPNDLYAQAAMAVLLQEMRKDPKAEALAELLTDVPGTEQLVESIRQEAKNRRLARMLVERKALPEVPARQPPKKVMMWLVTFSIMVAGLWILVQPTDAATIAICVLFPLLMLWCLYKLMD